MAIENQYPTVNEDGSSSPRDTALAIQRLMEGKANNRDEVTLTLNSATTTLVDVRLTAESQVDLMPLDANAAAENWWISGRTDGSVTINHANNATVRLFQYAIVG